MAGERQVPHARGVASGYYNWRPATEHANHGARLDTEIKEHEAVLETLARAQARAPMAPPGVSTGTVPDMLVVLGDNPAVDPTRSRQ